MSLGRRKALLNDPSDWVFNAMADVYSARPAYPTLLVEALAELCEGTGRICDIGAGIGHLALPLAARGFDVLAVEPALSMLAQLGRRAESQGVRVKTLHATAEQLPVASEAFDLVVLSDAIHFLDKELASAEVARVLAPRGALAIVTAEFSDTPYMRGVRRVMEESAPRRPRAVAPAIAQFSAIARTPLRPVRRFHDETPLDPEHLEAVLRSISFIGPAMNPQRFEAFRQRIHALPGPAVWARTFTLHAGWRGRRVARSVRPEPKTLRSPVR